MNQKYRAEDFLEASAEEKEQIIEVVLKLDSHNFINKDALVEIIKYQNKNNEVEE